MKHWDPTTREVAPDPSAAWERELEPDQDLALTLVWSAEGWSHCGEVLRLPAGAEGDGPHVFGRRHEAPSDGLPRLHLQRERPIGRTEIRPATWPELSRQQLELKRQGPTRLNVRVLGRRGLVVGGRPCREAQIEAGTLLEIPGVATFLSELRPSRWSDAPARLGEITGEFSEPDAFGQVGEGVATWKLRWDLCWASQHDRPTLILGSTGVGKELASLGLHRGRGRGSGPLIITSGAQLSRDLAGLELLGSGARFLGPKDPPRVGLVAAADGGTLYIDEFGELPAEVQAALLRVIETRTFNPLGSTTPVSVDVSFIGATNRPLSHLRRDLVARFYTRVQVPPLSARRGDIPLLARHLIRRHLSGGGGPAWVSVEGARELPRLTQGTVRRLLAHPFSGNVRELDALLHGGLRSMRRGMIRIAQGALVARAGEETDAATPHPSAADPRAARPDTGGGLPQPGALLAEEPLAQAWLEHHFNIGSLLEDPRVDLSRATLYRRRQALFDRALREAEGDAEQAASLLCAPAESPSWYGVRNLLQRHPLSEPEPAAPT